MMLLPLTLAAQTKSALDLLKSDPRRAYGNDYPYHFSDAQFTKAPSGYKAFYISHYSRHGSRYYWNEYLYKSLDTLLTKAHDLHQLTPQGETFFQRYNDIKQELITGWGELTQMGWQQHQGIAHTMYSNFPEVFRKGGQVSAVSSLVGRCMLSMSSFCQELARNNPSLEIRQQASRFTLNSVVSDDKQNPLRKKYPKSKPRFEQNRKLFKGHQLSADTIASRVFTSIEGLNVKNGQILYLLTNLYTSLPNAGYDHIMEGILNDNEIASSWEEANLGSYSWVFTPRYNTIPILQDIIDKTDAVITGKSNHLADLRFGHDTYLGPLTVLMGINGADLDPENPDEVKNCYQNWETCMASNIQLIFYRSSKSKEILVKCLLNGEEAKLPVPTTQAPYYKWSDFRSFYLNRIKLSIK